MRFEWDKTPDIVTHLRALAIADLIGAMDERLSNYLRGKITAYDEILRLPTDAEEELRMKDETSGYER